MADAQRVEEAGPQTELRYAWQQGKRDGIAAHAADASGVEPQGLKKSDKKPRWMKEMADLVRPLEQVPMVERCIVM